MLRARLARGNAAGPAGSATLVAAALPSPKKVRRVPDLAVQLRRTGLVVGAVLGAYLLGRLALGLWTLVAVFVGFAWAWDRFAPDLEDSPSRSGSLEDLHASSGDVQREPKQARTVDETGYSPGTSSIQTVTAPDGTVLTQITESVQWLNIAVARAWDVAQPLVSQIAQRAIDRALSTTLPPLVQSIKLDQFSLGATPPKIIAVSSFPDVVFCHEMKLPVLEVAVRLRWAPDDPPEFIFNRPPTPPDDDGRKGSSASSATKPGLGARSATAPPALNRSSVDSAASASTLMSDFSGESKSDDVHPLGQHSTIKLKVTTAGALPVTLTVGASKVSLDATIFLRLYPAQPFGPPWITRLQLRAFDPPETSLVLNPLGGSFDVFDVPYLRNWIRDGIDAGLGTLLCENGGIKIDFDQDGDPIVSLGLERPHFESSAGVLEFWIYEAKGLKNVDRLRFLGSKNDPFVRIMLGEKQLDQTEHRNNTLDPVFNHVTPILVPESVFTGGAKSEDHIKDFALNLHVCDMNDITKPARIGFLSLDLEDLCNGYLADRSLRLSGKPKDCWLPLTSRRTGEHRGTLRVGYRYFPAGDPLARGALIGAQLRSGILRVTIMSIDFAGAQFWQGHIRASLFDKEIFRGVSRQVWVKDLIVEEFEVYVSDLASAVLSLRIHHGASREEIVSARPGIPLPTEPNEGDGSVAGESVLNVIEVLEAPAPDHWYPLGGVSAKDIKSAQDSRVGLMIKFSLRPLLTGEDEAAPVPGPAIGGDAPIALFPGSSGASLSDLSSRNLVPVTENPPLGIIEFLVLEAKEMSPTGLNAKYADFYTRLIKVWGPTNQVEMARSEVVSKMLEPIWPPPERPWCVTISKFTKSRIALWNQNRMRPDDLYGYQEVGLPEGRSPEDLMEGGLGDLFGGVLSEEPDPIRGAGWFVLSVPLKKELLRGTNVFQMAKHKISVAARLLPIWLPDERMLPEPGTLAVLRLVIHQIQGVVNGRANLFVEIVDSERLLARSSLRLNARDPLWNETFDTFVGAIRMDKPVTIAVKKAIGSSYNRASRISSLTTSVGELLMAEPAKWYAMDVGLIRLSAHCFTVLAD